MQFQSLCHKTMQLLDHVGVYHCLAGFFNKLSTHCNDFFLLIYMVASLYNVINITKGIVSFLFYLFFFVFFGPMLFNSQECCQIS